MQEELRTLQRSLTAADPADCLRLAARMRTQLDGLTAGLVGRARCSRTTWSRIGHILGISEDTARHRYTDHYILRRLAELTRMSPPPATLNDLYPGSTPRQQRSPVPMPPRGSIPTRPRPAFNRLAPVLSMLARNSGLSMKDLSQHTRCSASYLSRILSGERIPTWPLTERFARACGADAAVLRSVWETERLRSNGPLPEQEEEDTDGDDEDPIRAGTRLLTALRTLHVRAGQPTAYSIATASKRPLPVETVTTALDGTQIPGWCDLVSILHVLGGEIPYFQPLWENANRPPDPEDSNNSLTAAPHRDPSRQPHRVLQDQLSPASPGPAPRPSRLCDIITSYREALTEQAALRESQRERLLHRLLQRQRPTQRPTLRLTALTHF
ncbi:helix-turn-helix transcriptional regulator [Streptomyces sp. VNUA116]|uniref:helix-turn-helix domain-containing protein n=1 Tax=Streptomyces sp. VNUA116 TaxID=3062449 RepID=UPI0026758C6C|nr:helix-turn-helix transcriptional regulator [Streptomyces sp. VNUA116]WKU42642.1 helix-turn-helix transcriptional regulator [Streptomyces sp. VNUA116]